MIDDAEKLEVPPAAEEIEDDDSVVESPLAETAEVKVDEDAPEVDVPVGDALRVVDPTEDESIGPEPAGEDDVGSSNEDVNEEDVIEAERLGEESE